MIGLSLIIAAVAAITVLITKALKQQKGHLLLLFAIVHLVAIAVAAFFMHVFEKPLVQFGFTIFLFTIIALCYSKKIIFFIGTLALMAISYVQWGHYLLNYQKYKSLDNASELYNAGYVSEAIYTYQRLFNTFKEDPTYLAQYAEILSTCDVREAESVLKLLCRKKTDYIYWSHLGDCYYKNGKLKEAEYAYKFAVNMVPNRFVPRYNLFLFYSKIGRRSEFFETGDKIMRLPIKIASPVIDNIKNQVKKQLLLKSRSASFEINI
ncbi:tetratricopeptide repeat protein [Mucilaginibacter terrae]|uniref:tetratricopeptide repeat protein n=1 Tax=Mucilaginibacter terrae TaxID=1955052 RepID=UPI00362992AB